MRNLRDYAVVTGAYWVFTLTDGALRMLVLLYLHQLGRSPLEIASLFLAYEALGVVTNFGGGWLGARFGLKSTLIGGLGLQVAACGLLAGQAASLSVPLVLGAQALSGVAKDLTKMSSKSYIKLVVPAGDEHGLMRWVALLTGSKNTLKGVGFFLGGWLLVALGFRGACVGMAGALVLTWCAALLLLPPAAGKAKQRVQLAHLIARDARVNWLSASRLFLFGARDIWFVLALPIFLSSSLGWSHSGVGGFLAAWVILYGLVQANAPRWLGAREGARRAAPDAARLGRLTASLVVPLAAIAVALYSGLAPTATLVAGLVLFGVLFALNSALHSYLIIAYAREGQVSLDVGFYYMANAMGRLIGTLLSGALYQWAGQGSAGLLTCLAGSALFCVFSALLCAPLRAAERATLSSA